MPLRPTPTPLQIQAAVNETIKRMVHRGRTPHQINSHLGVRFHTNLPMPSFPSKLKPFKETPKFSLLHTTITLSQGKTTNPIFPVITQHTPCRNGIQLLIQTTINIQLDPIIQRRAPSNPTSFKPRIFNNLTIRSDPRAQIPLDHQSWARRELEIRIKNNTTPPFPNEP